MEKEVYWSRFADDFEEKLDYVVGPRDLALVKDCMAKQTDLNNTLELGCGCGTYTRLIAPRASQLAATDLSDEMLNAAADHLKEFDNVTVQKQNCHGLSYGDNTYDTVIMANLLHIVPEPEKAIAESARVLKPGGRAIVLSFTTQGMKFPHKLGMAYRYFRAWGKPSASAKTLTVQMVSDMLTAHGFEIQEARLIGRRCKAIFSTAIIRK